MGENRDQVAEAITEHWGERCPDFEPTCWCCKAWAQYDALRAAPAAERERCAKIADAEAAAMERVADSYRVPKTGANITLAHLHDQGAVVAGQIAAAIRSGVEDGRG